LGNRNGCAGVYTRKNYINLEVHLNYRLDSAIDSKVEQASANRYHHTIKLTGPADRCRAFRLAQKRLLLKTISGVALNCGRRFVFIVPYICRQMKGITRERPKIDRIACLPLADYAVY
jgi:hypothetical protein